MQGDAVDDLGQLPGDARYGPWSTPRAAPDCVQLVVVEPLRRLVCACFTARDALQGPFNCRI
jgi:hypothetical protein